MYPLSNQALRENPAPQQDVDDMSIKCNCGAPTETELSGPSPAPIVAHNGRVNNHPSTALCTVQDCGNLSCMFTRTSSTVPSINIPPWARGVSLRVGPLGSGCADHPPVQPRRTHNPAPGTNWLRRSRSTPKWAPGLGPVRVHDDRQKVRCQNCSASCGSKTARRGMESCGIFGTAMTCSRIAVSRSLRTSTSWSTICGTGTSRICTIGAKSASCSTACRWTRSCGPRGSTRRPRTPHGVFLIEQREERRIPGHTGLRRAVRGLPGPCRVRSP